MEQVTLKIKKLDEKAVIPSYAHDGDVCMDMTAISVEYDEEKDCYIYHTGIAVETEKGYGMLLFPRSSNRKTFAYLCNHVGVVDSSIYRGEIMFCFKNRTPYAQIILNRAYKDCISTSWLNVKNTFKAIKQKTDPMNFAPYKVGDRIGQLVIIPYPKINIEVVDELSETERGEGGFGSTGA